MPGRSSSRARAPPRVRPRTPARSRRPAFRAGSSSADERLALLPVRAAELPRLERLNRAQDLTRAAPDREIIDGDRADDPTVVDDDRGAIGDALILLQDPEGPADDVAGVGEDRMRDSLREGLPIAKPPRMRKERVGADADDRHVLVFEILRERLEALDLGRTHEGEIERVPVEHMPAAAIVLRRDRALLSTEVRNAGPRRLALADERRRGASFCY